MMNSKSSSDIRINQNELSSILPSSILPIAPNFFPSSSMLNFSNIEEKIIIQHTPEVDNFILDSDLPIFMSQVLPPLGSGCDRCFASERVNGTLPQPDVDELDAYLANATNIVPIGANQDVDSRTELCEAIDQADGTADQVTEEDIRILLEAAIENPPPGQVQQVIDCLILAGLITETQREIVVETSIDSAIDGNDDPVENLSSTTSNDINFTFSGHVTPEGTEVDSQGFQCRLDEQPNFVPCNGPTTIDFTGSQLYTDLSPGVHTFTVSAFVVVNEQPIFDQTPETFTWTIIPIVVETSIDSAIDGNDDPVENLSSTTSNDIEFTFSGATNADDEQVTERGFVCVLDGETIDCTDDTGESFTSSEEFLNLSPGTHSFTVRAFVQVSEEVRIEDQTPETFTWTIEEEEEEPPEEPEEPEEP